MNGQESHQTTAGPYYGVFKAVPQGEKRKNEDDGPFESDKKRKRDPYVCIACNECKRRKIRCNGQRPCQRCGKMILECIYVPNCGCTAGSRDSKEYQDMLAHMQSLLEEINNLYAGIETLRNGQRYRTRPNHAEEPSPLDPTLASSDSSGPYPNTSSPYQAHGSQSPSQSSTTTSSASGIDVARSRLVTMGNTAPEVQEGGVSNEKQSDGAEPGKDVEGPCPESG